MTIKVCVAGATGWAGEPLLTARIHASASEALAQPCDVFVEYTKPDVARNNIRCALERGAHVVVGTSGLGDDDYAQIDTLARAKRFGPAALTRMEAD